MAGVFANDGRGTRAGAIVAVLVLTISVGVLSVLALQHGSSLPEESASPSLPATPGASEPPESLPTSPETPAAPAASADERFLALQGDQLWRGIAGVCGGDAPIVELSTDGGESWSDVTPSRLGLGQVLGLAAFGDRDGDIVGAVDADCEPTALRTYTAGVDWEAYENLLGSATYVSPTDGRTVVTPTTRVDAPCARPVSLRTSRGEVGLICEGGAYRLDGDAWTELASGAIAVDAVAGTIVVAHIDDSCTGGVAITQFDSVNGRPLACVESVDPRADAALSVVGDVIALWTGDDLLIL